MLALMLSFHLNETRHEIKAIAVGLQIDKLFPAIRPVGHSLWKRTKKTVIRGYADDSDHYWRLNRGKLDGLITGAIFVVSVSHLMPDRG